MDRTDLLESRHGKMRLASVLTPFLVALTLGMTPLLAGGAVQIPPHLKDKKVLPLEYDVVRYECPAETHVTFKWTNKIGANPQFSLPPQYDAPYTAHFTQSTYHIETLNNSVSCYYASGPIVGHYEYKVNRHIISCTGIPGRVFECKLRK